MNYSVGDRVLLVMNILKRPLGKNEIGTRIGGKTILTGYETDRKEIESALSDLTKQGLMQEKKEFLGKKYELTYSGKTKAQRLYKELSGENNPILAYFKVKDAMESMFR